MRHEELNNWTQYYRKYFLFSNVLLAAHSFSNCDVPNTELFHMSIWLMAAGLVLTSVSASLANDWDYDSKKAVPFGGSAANAS